VDSYTVSSDASKDYRIVVKAKAASGPVNVDIMVGDEVRTVTISDKGWNEINVGTVALASGANRLKCVVKSGVADVDWFELNPADNSQRAASGLAPEVPR